MSRRLAASVLVGAIMLLVGCAHGATNQDTTLVQEMRLVSTEALFSEGVAHALRGDHLRAEQYLSAAGKRGYHPESVATWLVRVCVSAGRYRAALDHGTEYLRTHPSDNWLRFVVANLYDALGDPVAARSELEAIVAAEPLHPLAHYRLGVLQRERLADAAGARVHFTEYLLLAPDGPHAAEARSILGSPERSSIRGEPGPSKEPTRGNLP
ncbi:MAG: tetratricopeptide repeat protein [Myxococcota bacterium]